VAQSARTTQLIEKARGLKMTPAQKHAQRVSLVVGLSRHNAAVSRDSVDAIVTEYEGLAQ
jgi:acyl-CoA hydrolase